MNYRKWIREITSSWTQVLVIRLYQEYCCPLLSNYEGQFILPSLLYLTEIGLQCILKLPTAGYTRQS